MAARWKKQLCKAPEVERTHVAFRTGWQWEGGSPGVKAMDLGELVYGEGRLGDHTA